MGSQGNLKASPRCIFARFGSSHTRATLATGMTMLDLAGDILTDTQHIADAVHAYDEKHKGPPPRNPIDPQQFLRSVSVCTTTFNTLRQHSPHSKPLPPAMLRSRPFSSSARVQAPPLRTTVSLLILGAVCAGNRRHMDRPSSVLHVSQ